MLNTGDSLDFDQLRCLARKDPVAFEVRRRELIEAAIARAPERRRRRLRGLQWRVDLVRSRSSCPLEACISLSEMMWESFAGTNGTEGAVDSVGEGGSSGKCGTNAARRPRSGISACQVKSFLVGWRAL